MAVIYKDSCSASWLPNLPSNLTFPTFRKNKKQIPIKIGRVCQQNGDISVLDLGQDVNNCLESERALHLDLEDLT